MENGGLAESANPATLIKEAIHVISCGYEEKTEWGKEVGWIYGSVTEDVLTGFKMHCEDEDQFIIPTLSNMASVLFLGLFLSIIVTVVFELRWSGVSIEDLWRNEQFRVIGGFLKMMTGIDTNFTVTAQAAEFGELYIVKWTALLIPPTWLVWLLDSPMHSTKGMKLGVHFLAKSFSPSGLSSISILSSKA
ncbi:hypothetical protein GQ457_07G029730 [Hibiscus cannabinus]